MAEGWMEHILAAEFIHDELVPFPCLPDAFFWVEHPSVRYNPLSDFLHPARRRVEQVRVLLPCLVPGLGVQSQVVFQE
eukprot:CAMPEP_0118997104 /NCGR_PEP_ID=MMETSP1173-20130426/61202_1 /TAXON_ID=1034831 /ORGANISM="Rhizochromulina marina cf, Strain CCMP1243" /LENGTH=77 /DNA_ID=CAMNT_0006948523 /DNA_START=103 /DNA_END=333 /DNA_ORIENTATION=+